MPRTAPRPLPPVEEAQPLAATPSPEITEAAGGVAPASDVTETPADVTPSPEVTETPADVTPSPEMTETPADVTPSPEVTETPADATPSPEVTDAPADATPSPEVTDAPADATPAPEETEEPQEEPEEELVYTLHLVHVFRFKLDGKNVSVQAKEDVSLTEADFVDGMCDISRFACEAEQLTVTRANPLSINSFTANREGGAQILYAVAPGWRVVRSGAAEADSVVLRDVFQGNLGDYEFVPVNSVTVNVNYKYSNTGSLAGINAFDPEAIVAEVAKQDDGNYKLTLDMSQKTIEGFRLVLNPEPLNQYLVSPPTGYETAEQLKQMLDNGSFNVNVNNPNMPVYYYQEAGGAVGTPNPAYGNIYSTEYNNAWNDARKLTNTAYSAEAKSGSSDQPVGANQIQSPKIEITLTAEQLDTAKTNGLDLTIFYRRNATWYTVKHWVQHDYSSYSDQPFGTLAATEKETVDGVNYVLENTEQVQGRVGALTNAKVRTDGIYRYVSPVSFSQKEIAEKDTVVEIFYKIPAVYTVIFDTDYTYIPRQQVNSEEFVNFNGINEPKRTGYTFGGWQYLKEGATPDTDGNYAYDAYIPVEKGADYNYTLRLTREIVTDAKIDDVGGELVLHIYPIWVPDKTQVRIVLWTEDLAGTDDVYAAVTGGVSTYYNSKYASYGTEPVTYQHDNPNASYSNMGSFTIEVNTDSELVENGNLITAIQDEVNTRFTSAMGQSSGLNVSAFYRQADFEIVHEEKGQINSDTTTANADGKTMIYVYYTRNVYELLFTYYGTATRADGNSSNFCVADSTNGYSYSNGAAVPNGSLNFAYNGSHNGGNSTNYTNGWMRANVTSASQMPVPQTITIRAKYGADLRNVWPVARSTESVNSLDNNAGRGTTARMISWATTDGKYCEGGRFGSGAYNAGEPTIMGTYAAMSAEIVADPTQPVVYNENGSFSNSGLRHNLVAYWFNGGISYYRNNHCFEVPGLDVRGMQTVRIYVDNNNNVRDLIYLVPVDNATITDYNFTDLMKVSYSGGTITYDDPNGNFYAVRAYTSGGTTKYYAIARQVDTVSSNTIAKQNPSARLHMTRANTVADHSTQYADTDGAYNGTTCGTQQIPYDLYFYYNRDRYTITYMAPQNNTSAAGTEVTLGTIELPYGAEVTEDKYGFTLDYQDMNTATVGGTAKYPWNTTSTVAVCPDRSTSGTAAWAFEGWALGPAGVNMQWANDGKTTTAPFNIEGNLRVYAIWDTPSYTVTFHLNGGNVDGNASDIIEEIPANTRYSASGSIPRPHRGGYVFQGWFNADASGNPIDPQHDFDFDQAIAENKHVVALWQPVSNERFNYTVWYVTTNPLEEHKNNDKQTLDGTKYTVLDKGEHNDEMFTDNMVVNLMAVDIANYVPVDTIKTFTPKANENYNIVFVYNPIQSYTHTVRFIKAGTETDANPSEIHHYEVYADRTVTTPNAAELEKVTKLGYRLVNRTAENTYTPVTDARPLTWLDGNNLAATPNTKTTLVGEQIPAVIVYLVQPATYKISYENAATAPAGAEAALAAVTAAVGTLPGVVEGKNPTLYSSANEFTLKKPASFIEDGKLYTFRNWTLGPNTKLADENDDTTTFNPLIVSKNTEGDLTFIANWDEVNVYSLTVNKHVSGNAAEYGRDFAFTVTLNDAGGNAVSGTYGELTFNDIGVAEFTLKHNESKTATGIPSGYKYTVAENDYTAEGYTTRVTGGTGDTPAADGRSITGTMDGNKNVTFNNVKNTYHDLTVSKTVDSASEADKTTDFHFTVTLNDNTVTGTYGGENGMTFTNGVANITLKHGESKTATALPNGVTYTVTETEAANFSTSYKVNDGAAADGRTATGTLTADATVAFTNTKATGSLTVTKAVEGGAGETDREFNFTVTLTDAKGAVSGTFGGIAFDADGKASFKLTGGQSKQITDIPVGVNYAVEETDADGHGYVTTTPANATGTISADGTTVTFTNIRDPYLLTVSKAVTGNGGDTNAEFHFTVVLYDTSDAPVRNTTVGNAAFDENGEYSFNLSANDTPVIISGIPNGYSYTVTEDDYSRDGYTTSVTGGTPAASGRSTSGTINGADASVTFTNERGAGSLTVTKVLSGNATEAGKVFYFTLTLTDVNDQPVSGEFGGVKFEKGQYRFSLKGGENKIFAAIPNTVKYTVAEDNYTNYGYTTSVAKGTADATTGRSATGTFDAAHTSDSVTFTNARSHHLLTVKKVLAGNTIDPDAVFNFTVTLRDNNNQPVDGVTYGGMTFTNGEAKFSLKADGVKTASNIPDSYSYKVVEDDADQNGYITTVTGDAQGTFDGDKSVTFTNTKNTTHKLTVAKTVVSASATDKATAFNFTVTLKDETGATLTSIDGAYGGMTFNQGVAEFTLADGGTVTAENLPNGVTYTIRETKANQDNFTTTVTGGTLNADGSVTGTLDGADAAVAFTNTKATGGLTVRKAVDGNVGDTTKAFNFTVTLGDTSISGKLGGDADGMTFTNGVATFQLANGQSKTATGLPVGVSYTVTETEDGKDGYTTTKQGDTGTIGATPATAIFTNSKDAYYKLDVKKIVDGDGADVGQYFSFSLTLTKADGTAFTGDLGGLTFDDTGTTTFQLKHNETKTITAIPHGTRYVLAENDYSGTGYTTTTTGDKVTGTFDADKSVTFTNTRPLSATYGSLVVSKSVTGDAGETDRDFHFTVTLSDKTVKDNFGDIAFTDGVASFTLHHGESKNAIGLPHGVTYTVTETEANTDGYTTTSVNASGSIVGNQVTNVSFTNARSVTPPDPGTGDLTVSKTVTGIWGERSRSFLFKVTLYDAVDNAVAESVDGQFGQMSFTKGTALFTLRHGESITASGLPAGLRYTVEERDDAGYITTAYGNTGTITGSRTVTASFVNYKGTQPRTGDDTNLALWLTLMGASLFVLTALPATYVRKSKKRTGR